MYNNKFVLSIIQDGRPVKETGWGNNKEVAIPFDSEYKIRLKNKNDRSCTARVFIDGKEVSKLGDVIITPGGTIDLERYIDRSLNKGKKFKFVPLDHQDVDDPTSSSNGVIEVEFRKAKQQNGIKIDWHEPVWPAIVYPPYKEDNNGPQWTFCGGDRGGTAGATGDVTTDIVTYSASNVHASNNGTGKLRSFKKGFNDQGVQSAACTAFGATVEGSKSNQQFTYSNLEVEDHVVTLKLKIVGIEKRDTMRDTKYKYCAQCGQRVKRVDKYCFECGNKI